MVGGGHGGADEMDCGSFFDQIEDLLDFPADDIASGISGSLDSFPSIWSESLSNNAASELSVPYEDIVQLEWLSTFVEDSFTLQKPNDAVITKDLFHTTSPISVLESSTASNSSGKKPDPQYTDPQYTDPQPMGKRVKARSKRTRPATFSPRPAMQLAGSPDSENHAESRPVIIKIAKKHLLNTREEKKKKKKMKSTVIQQAAPTEVGPEQPVRKCLHCEITKTPQWRAGPLGPKTLCNACGVRYKSGRLFPEYRPAASPTFVPSVHSNSHKKVVEMRNKTCDSSAGARKSVITISLHSELIPNTNVQLDYM